MMALYDLCDEIEEHEDAKKTLVPFFNLLEENPDTDFGTPGPIVHFLETYYKNGYEELLLESLQRRVVSHTLWMLNRVINGSVEPEKAVYLTRLREISQNETLLPEILDEAKRFLKFQER